MAGEPTTGVDDAKPQRLFAAFDLPGEVRDGLAAWSERELTDPALRPVRAEALHMTVCFLGSTPPERAVEAYRRVRQACAAEGRDPDELTYSAMTGVLVGRDETEVEQRTNDLLRIVGAEGDDTAWLEDRTLRWVYGTPDQARARVAEFEAAGVQRIMLQTFQPRDLDMVRLMAEVLIR